MDRRMFLMTAAMAGASSVWDGKRSRRVKTLLRLPTKPRASCRTFRGSMVLTRCCRHLKSKRPIFLRKRWPRSKSRAWRVGCPITGLPKEIGPHDEQIAELVKKSGAVGVSFAIAVNRKLKVARGVGHLSSHERLPATPTAPGYLGSVTKPLCATTALTLVRDGKLQLDQKVMEVLPMTPLLKPGEKRQPEIDQVTVRMLMNHMSGLFQCRGGVV